MSWRNSHFNAIIGEVQGEKNNNKVKLKAFVSNLDLDQTPDNSNV